MSISTEQNKISRLETQLSDLRKKDAQEARKEADYMAKANKASADASKSRTSSSIGQKLREAESARKHAASATTKRAAYAKDIAQKNTELMKARTALANEEAKQRKKTSKEIEKQRADQARRQRELETRTIKAISTRPATSIPGASAVVPTYDVFFSHASEDKEDFVRELAVKATEAGLRVFYDEMTLTWGDSLRRKIEEGLANSRFGVVVLSDAFFKKEWPQRELDGLFGLEIEGRSLILPIWHKISKDEVMKKAPSLAGKLALNTASLSVDEIVQKLVEVVKGS